MSSLTYLLVAASYAVVAAVAGLVLAESVSDVPRYVIYLAAGAGFLVALMGHEILLRRREGREMADLLDHTMDELEEMRELQRGLMGDMSRAREEMAQLCEVVEGATEGANRTLLREVRVLQEQLGHLSPDKRAAIARLGLPSPGKIAAGLAAEPGPDMAQGGAAKAPADTPLEQIREALEANRVDLYLQPVVSLPQRRTRYYEAFSRLRTAEGKLLTPDQYLDAAAELGLIATIDNLLLFRCVQLVRRLKKRRPDVGFFINISSHTLEDGEFLAQFADFLESNRNLASSLIFEFAQRDVRGFPPEVTDQLARLSRRGFRFSMDQIDGLDFDAGGLEALGFGFVKVPAQMLLADPGESLSR
ncbi:MAG TPA: EAL domain-containing protein, partial [Alphaproteobacteria bacterium]|nr:EAL domain-containing protein [Alphaproteobacteria bacterium]